MAANNLYSLQNMVGGSDAKKIQNKLENKGVYGNYGSGAITEAEANKMLNAYQNAVLNAANSEASARDNPTGLSSGINQTTGNTGKYVPAQNNTGSANKNNANASGAANGNGTNAANLNLDSQLNQNKNLLGSLQSTVLNGTIKEGDVTDASSQNALQNMGEMTPAAYQQYVLNEQIRAQNDQMMQILQQQYNEQQAALKAQTQATIDSINSNRKGIEDAYQKAQKEAYINSVLQQNQMGDYLAAAGYTGGMAESTLSQINNNYANNRQAAVSERDAANLEIDRLVAEAQATGNTNLADAATNYYNSYLTALQNQQQLDYQMAQDVVNQMNTDRTYAAEQAQQQWENDWYEKSYADQLAQQQWENNNYTQQLADETAREQAAQDFDTFANTYQGKYTKRATYEKWIENLEKMDDPYGYNKQKIAYLRQYINSGMGKTSGSSDSGSGSDKTEETATPAVYDPATYTPSAAVTSLINSITEKMGPGVTSAVIGNAVMNAIDKAVLNKTINDADVEYILSRFGIK